MTQSTTPTDPDPRFLEFLEKSDAIAGEKLAAAIPREYMQPSVARGFIGFAVSWALYVGAIVAMAVLDRWYLVAPLVLVAGLGGWGLHCIGHDCGHGSFSRNRRLNFVIGHLSLLPLFYPFHAWRHAHNLHHAHTNSLELDTDWRPISEAVYRRMPLRERIIYISSRTWAVWAGTINYWAQSAFRPSYYPKKEMRRDVRRSILFVLTVGGAYLTLLTYLTGWQGLLLYFIAPWFATHAWFSFTTLMHHSSEDIPYLSEQHWTRNASRLLVTTDYVYPRWLLFLTHNISIHTAHHVSPAVPFYNLRKAQAALKQAYPGMVRVEKASAPKVWNILRKCRFYDPISGLYSTRRMQRGFGRGRLGVSGGSVLAAGLVRAHRVMPRLARSVHTSMFINTRRLGSFPDDLCPVGARRVELAGVPRVAAVYLWGSDEPTVLALHGWGTDSTTMSTVVDAALASGESAITFDAPGHGASPGSHALITEYAHAALEVLHRFPRIQTIVAHSLASIAAVSAVANSDAKNVRNMLLLAPTCSLSHVLERWVTQQGLPRRLAEQIYRQLERRDGVSVSHWDIRTLGLPTSVRVRILHDPTDESVPLSDSYLIAAAIPADVREAVAGIGHHRIIGSDEMRAALTACLQSDTSQQGPAHV